ncbi:RNA polymerase sigma factor [Chitinophaga japonensis]|uniref:RNA polymerase sigma factor (Sigma-70 family) n=1 Tax=Chitinophaga japonensis TaxID=104662 RepID=A0A562STZ2_CHIJA|nr:sigma-70 family RNA polymerase sigma factor [Chitinophaga japonensis]TWI84216.1 RNA polymerase sigma factor (sigma-70 family) [Chitinophaga japonensis]
MTAGTTGNETWWALKSGGEEALLKLYNEHYIGLVNYGTQLVHDRELAVECFTELLIDLWDKRDRLPMVENVRSYLLSCMRRAILHKIKSAQRRQEKEQQLSHMEATYEASYEERLQAVQMDEARKRRLLDSFEKLTPRQQELLKLRYFDNLSYEAIAEKCNISIRTTYNIIHNALKSLRQDLDASGAREQLPPLPVLLVFILMHYLAQ